MELHYFGDQQNALKYTIQQDSLSDMLDLFTSEYSSKLYNFKIRSFENMEKIYKAYWWAHGKHKYKQNVEIDIVSTLINATPTKYNESLS